MSKWSGLVCITGTHDAAISVQKTTVKSGFSNDEDEDYEDDEDD